MTQETNGTESTATANPQWCSTHQIHTASCEEYHTGEAERTQEIPRTGQRATRQAGALETGDHILVNGQPQEVRHVERYVRMGTARVLIVVAGGRTWDGAADFTVSLADDVEVADAAADVLRAELAGALNELAGLIIEKRLPLPSYVLSFTGVLDSRADLFWWAAALGAEIKPGGPGNDGEAIPIVTSQTPIGGDLLFTVEMQA